MLVENRKNKRAATKTKNSGWVHCLFFLTAHLEFCRICRSLFFCFLRVTEWHLFWIINQKCGEILAPINSNSQSSQFIAQLQRSIIKITISSILIISSQSLVYFKLQNFHRKISLHITAFPMQFAIISISAIWTLFFQLPSIRPSEAIDCLISFNFSDKMIQMKKITSFFFFWWLSVKINFIYLWIVGTCHSCYHRFCQCTTSSTFANTWWWCSDTKANLWTQSRWIVCIQVRRIYRFLSAYLCFWNTAQLFFSNFSMKII